MNIREKINMDLAGLEEYGPITIVAFGDSVTHGAVGPDEIDYETVYWNRLKQKINARRNYVPVNVINAGIGGAKTSDSVERMDKQVLVYNPDLLIVCFGLNDINLPLEEYVDALGRIFGKAADAGVETIFMTPNMLNTYVAEGTEEKYLAYAAVTAEYQTSGRMDRYMEAAMALARERDIPVCDCYGKWKEFAKTQDTTLLLANRINHPTREMHELFAQSLYDMIFEADASVAGTESTMYRT